MAYRHISTRPALLSASLLLAAPGALAQAPSVALASFSSDTAFPRAALADEGLAFKCATSPEGTPFLPSVGWRSWMGDIDGDGAPDVPGDVDALFLIDPRRGPVPSNVVFSLQQDEGPFEDGDLLTRRPDGRIVRWRSEADLRQALGTTSTSVDVDAATRLADGTLLFSLASDLASSNAGPLQDGDVLALDVQGALSVLYREADLQAIAEAAFGAGIGAILDCIALSQDPIDDVLVFVVQAPSAHDATALRVTGNPVFGFAEADWGFQRATEIDALALFRGSCDPPSWITTSPATVQPGQILTLDVAGGTPAGLWLLLFGATPGELVVPGLHGVGALLLDPLDPLFQFSFSRWSELIGAFDGQGNAQVAVWTEALAPLPFDLQFQVIDLVTATVSTGSLVQVR